MLGPDGPQGLYAEFFPDCRKPTTQIAGDLLDFPKVARFFSFGLVELLESV